MEFLKNSGRKRNALPRSPARGKTGGRLNDPGMPSCAAHLFLLRFLQRRPISRSIPSRSVAGCGGQPGT